MIVHITKETFEEEVLKSPVPTVLDFYADWCGPCMAQGKILEALDEKYQGRIKICKCNVDENEEFAESFGFDTIPTLLFYRSGEKLSQLSTVLQEPSILRLLKLD